MSKKGYTTCFICGEVFYKTSFTKHLNNIHGFKVKDYYDYINPSINKKCKHCNKDLKFVNLSKGYREFCSVSCKATYIERLNPEYAKNRGKKSHELGWTSKNGKRAHELDTSLASRMGKRAHELDPSLASRIGKLGAKKSKELYRTGWTSTAFINCHAKRCKKTGMFPSEKRLWEKFLNLFNFAYGKRFYYKENRYFIPDFVHEDYKIIIEVDGSWHEQEKIKQRDRNKDNIYTQNGYTVMRVTNEEIDKDIEDVISKMLYLR